MVVVQSVVWGGRESVALRLGLCSRMHDYSTNVYQSVAEHCSSLFSGIHFWLHVVRFGGGEGGATRRAIGCHERRVGGSGGGDKTTGAGRVLSHHFVRVLRRICVVFSRR